MSGPRTTRSDWWGAFAAGALVVFCCLILLRHDPLLFWNDDYELSILPVFADIARSWKEGHWPLLSPYSWVCSNLAGEFQYGTFSVFVNAAVVLIWKFPLTFSQQAAALSITHLFVLAAGAFLLARGRAFDFATSIFVSLVAALNGWIICWGATDWFGALGAFAWLPWAWWALEKSMASASRQCFGTDHRWDADATLLAAIWPAPFVYLVITGGFPYVVVMLALLIVWLSVKSLVQTRSAGAIAPMWIGVALGIGLAAPAWLALFDYIRGSAREINTASGHWQWIVPWRAWPGLVLPCWTMPWADFSSRLMPHPAAELASGLVAPVAVVSALIGRGRSFVRQMRWDLGLLLLVVLLAMMPTAGLFRWSFRWLPLFHLVLALGAAAALSTGDRPGLVALLLVGVTAVAVSVLRVAGPYPFPLTWIFLVLAGLWFVSDLLLRRSRLRRWVPAGLTAAAFLATYLCIPPNCGVPKYNLSQELLEPAPLDPDRLYLSIYPYAELTYRIGNRTGQIGQVVRPGSLSMWGGLRLVNGYSPVLAAGIAREFKFAIHGEVDWSIAEYLLRNQAGRGGLLEEMGVDGIIVAPESGLAPGSPDWQVVFTNAEGTIYHHRGPALERVRSVNWLDSLPEREFVHAKVSAIADTRNRMEADIDVPAGEHPALIKFSRPYFRGYVAKLGGRTFPVDSYRGLFPIVQLPPGLSGRLSLCYRPGWLLGGGAVSLMCAALWLAALFRARQSARRHLTR
jgi:hypothetical protein